MAGFSLGGATDESWAVLQRRLDQTRQDLADAFERARAVNYQPGSAQMKALQSAERRHRRARSLWHSHRQPDVDPEGVSSDAAGDPADTVIDLTVDRRVDLDRRPALDVPHPRADRWRPDGQGPER